MVKPNTMILLWYAYVYILQKEQVKIIIWELFSRLSRIEINDKKSLSLKRSPFDVFFRDGLFSR